MTDLTGTTLLYYRLTEKVGDGSVGSVYRAEDLRHNRPLAVKVIHSRYAAQESFQQQFLRDVHLMTGFDHDNVLDVHDGGIEGDTLYLVADYISGGNLRDFFQQNLRQQTYPPLKVILRYMIQIAGALHFAHDQNILHHALTPENVLIDPAPDGDPTQAQMIVSDTGIQQLLRSGFSSEITPALMTLPYLAPEICSGLTAGEEADIYSMGILMYEFTVGYPPFQPLNIGEAIRQHNSESPVPPVDLRAGVPERLNEIILQCLAKDPAERYNTAGELARDLEKLRQELEHVHSTQVNLQPAPETMVIQETLPGVEILHTIPEALPGAGDRLIIASQQQPTLTFPLEKDVVVIGRAGAADVSLDSERISRYHVRIERDGSGRYRVSDLGSTNGTWLDSVRLPAYESRDWQPGTALRLGEFRVFLEPTAYQMLTREIIQPDPADQVDPIEEFETVEQTPLDITASITPTRVTINPGDSQGIVLTIVNHSGRVDHFNIVVRNIPAGWVALPETSIEMLQDAQESLTITLTPPRESQSIAGVYSFEIVITSRGQPNTFPVVVYGQIQVEPFYGFSIDLHPTRLRRRNRAELTIENAGNTRLQYTITARDPEDNLIVSVDPPILDLPPGESETLPVQVRPRMRPILGRTEDISFEITVSDGHPDTQTQSKDARLTVRPWITRDMLYFGIILLGLCGAMSACALTQVVNFNDQRREQAILRRTQSAEQTATAVLELDFDNDGLSNLEERRLGTDPNNPDTDFDGLNDFTESKQIGTNPRANDTDGDTLSDAREVNDTRTSPNNPDTDGDGSPDNVDPAPLDLPTVTPSPEPTLPPVPPAG